MGDGGRDPVGWKLLCVASGLQDMLVLGKIRKLS